MGFAVGSCTISQQDKIDNGIVFQKVGTV